MAQNYDPSMFNEGPRDNVGKQFSRNARKDAYRRNNNVRFDQANFPDTDTGDADYVPEDVSVEEDELENDLFKGFDDITADEIAALRSDDDFKQQMNDYVAAQRKRKQKIVQNRVEPFNSPTKQSSARSAIDAQRVFQGLKTAFKQSIRRWKQNGKGAYVYNAAPGYRGL